jgi:hypothetical protein
MFVPTRRQRAPVRSQSPQPGTWLPWFRGQTRWCAPLQLKVKGVTQASPRGEQSVTEMPGYEHGARWSFIIGSRIDSSEPSAPTKRLNNGVRLDPFRKRGDIWSVARRLALILPQICPTGSSAPQREWPCSQSAWHANRDDPGSQRPGTLGGSPSHWRSGPLDRAG